MMPAATSLHVFAVAMLLTGVLINILTRLCKAEAAAHQEMSPLDIHGFDRACHIT